MSDSFDLEIRVVGNGYFVSPAQDASRGRFSPNETKVFESFDNLIAYLRVRLPIYPAFDPIAAAPKSKPR